jgi:hypothetical protein
MNPKEWSLLLAGCVIGCNDPIRPDQEFPIEGYVISGQANGTDPDTGEGLACVFIIDEVRTGGPLLGTWTDTATIRVTRMRTSPSQGVTYDTTITNQEVRLTVPDSTHIQLTVSGPLTESLAADMIPAYPGAGEGDWTCGPQHPLARVQPGIILTGKWRTQPILNLPIG